MASTDLSKFNNGWYNPGGVMKRLFWFWMCAVFFKSSFPFSSFKVFLLRLFGAKVGNGVVIKPYVNIKYPWFLSVGNHVWIGEEVWIDNLAEVSIGDHCCISQGAMLLCGNHDYTKSTFDLMTGKIILERGAWIGAKSTVCPGVICGEHSVLSVGSVASKNLDPNGIYRGNPATKIKERVIVS